jgi:gamma-glutamyltranspeptidase / glutathione hydrolase
MADTLIIVAILLLSIGLPMMDMQNLRVLSVALSVCFAASACSAASSRTAAANRQSSESIDSGWAFPTSRVSATFGAKGMVSSTDRVASEIGTEVIRRGGNAVDAAVATHFALAVVNPEAGNIGGGGFMIIRMADGRTAALDFREKAPLAATRDMYVGADGKLTDRSVVGHLAAGVPGSIAGMWVAHQRFGSLPWRELVQPAVTLADGIVVHDRLATSLREFEAQLRKYPATAKAFLIDGRAPRVGERLVQRDLAETLRRIAEGGKDGFYRGRTAALIETEMKRGGGIVTGEDLARYEAIWRDPITFHYRDQMVVSMPPPSSGGATLAEILNILEGYDLQRFGYLSADHIHVWTEAVKRAYADRNAYLADPDFVPQPTARMISDAYAGQRRGDIRMDRDTPSADVRPGLGPIPITQSPITHHEGANTTHYSIVDAAGNAVSVTTTLNSLYGSLVTVDGAGFLLNNEMDDFTTKPGERNQFGLVQGESNAIQPGKRMLSSMTPIVLLAPDGKVRLVTGTPGGATIVTTMAQIISDVVDFGMDIASASGAPRLHHQHLPDVLMFEHAGLPVAVQSALRSRGHTMQERAGYQGDTQSIQMLPNGVLIGVADPRRGGAAVAVEDSRQVVQ